MPRYVNNESEDESEPKTGRRTRAALAVSTTDSPIRRSTRIRHGSVNPDGSSPESVTGTAAAAPVTRVTRRRAAAAAANTSTVPEPKRTLRSRNNSVSSNVSDNFEIESVPGTPKARALRRLSIVEPSPSSPKPTLRTRRSTRASSETKSPQPVVRTTRRTRATSIDPEPIIDRTATPTKKRRQPVSALPSEPSLTEEANEDKVNSKINEVVQDSEPEIETETSPEKTRSESSPRSSPAKAKQLSKDETEKAKENIEDGEKLSEKGLEVSPAVDKSGNESEDESELLKTPEYQIHVEEASMANLDLPISTSLSHSLVIKTKRNSLSDKSKELGMKIEDLLNKSTEEQETSPGNKENQKLNIVSPDKKVKKNIEFTVSNVNIVRGKSIGSAMLLNKSSEKKANISLDERVSFKSLYEIVAPRSTDLENNKHTSEDSKMEEKSRPEKSTVVKSPKKNENQEVNGGEPVQNLKTGYTKIDETIVENEIIEEFTLYDSNDNDDDARSEFSLTVEEDFDNDKKTSFSKIAPENVSVDKTSGNKKSLSKERKIKSNDESASELNSDSSDDLFDKPNPNKIHSRKNSSEIIMREKEDTPKKRFSLNAKETENETKSVSKQDKKRKSMEIEEDRNLVENLETEQKTSGDNEANNLEIDEKSTKNIEKDEPMETNELEEIKADTNSAEKKSGDENTSMKEEKEKSLKLKEPKTKSSDQVSDSDSNTTIANLFHNISAEEWNNKKQKSPKEKRKSSLKMTSDPSQESKSKSHAEEDLISFENTPRKELVKEKDGGIEASNSDNMLILNQTDSAKESNKKKRRSSSGKKSNTSMEDKADEEMEVEKHSKSDKEEEKKAQEIDDNISEADTIPATIDFPQTFQDTYSAGEETEKEEQPKTTPKNKKNKSPAKSLTNSQKSDDQNVENSSSEEEESTDEDETTKAINPKAKPQRKKKKRGSALDKLKTPLGRNYSIVAVVDSDSGPEILSSDSSENSIPGFLFNAESSSDEIEKNESHNTIDSDIARELNLAGDNDLKYSDDDVPGDDCRDSESEHSDEEDEGSDIEDFVVADDDVESSEYSEEEEKSEPKMRFKRILDKSSSEEEEESMETEGSPVEEEDKSPSLKNAALKSVDLLAKKLDYSFDSNKAVSSSKKKTQKEKASIEVEDLEKNGKKLKKSAKQLKSLLNETIDLCTPVQDEDKSPGLNTSANKSIKKLRKSLVEDLATLTPGGNDSMQKNEKEREEEEEETMFTQETKTPKKDKKKTPKSEKKKQRNSIQLIEDTAIEGNDLTQETEEEEKELERKTPKKDKKKTPKSEKKKQRNSIQLIEESATDGNDLTEKEAEEEEEKEKSKIKTPGKEKKKTPKSERKKQRNSLQLIEGIATEEIKLTQETEEVEELKTKTPSKDKKTPKSLRKNQRDSIQLIEETALVSSKISDLNQTMLTPNSESPVTKFLKKEKLNESLPLLELKKRASRSLDKKVFSKMHKQEEEAEDHDSETEERKEMTEESEAEENEENQEGEDIEQVDANGHEGDEEEDDETDDEDQKKEEEIQEVDEENEREEETEEASEEEEIIVEKQKKRKSAGRKSLIETEESKFTKDRRSLDSGEKRLAKRQSLGSSNTSINGKEAELNKDDIALKKKSNLSNAGLEITNKKKRARLESSDTPQGLKQIKKPKMATLEAESDSDEAPESLGFVEARTEALQEMKEVAASLKAAKEAKKKKRRDQLERMRQEKEAKASKKSTLGVKTKPEGKNSLKRLPDDLLENLSEVVQRPEKKRKLLKKEEQELPSRYMFSPEKLPDGSLKIDKYDSSLSLGGSTTHFRVVNLEKVKKQPKKAAAVASFRDIMLARNPRQPVSAFLMYQAKQKASGKHLPPRK